MTKAFKTYREMVEILRSKNMAVDERAIPILKRENYYCLINGYKDFFLRPGIVPEEYRDGVSFDDVYSLFCLDREIRYVFFKAILDVETTLKSVISHRASEYYADDFEFYLKESVYTDNPKERKRLLRNIEILKELRNSDKDSIKHYRRAYGRVPFWVIVKDVTLGSLSHFYSLLGSTELQNEIARKLHGMDHDGMEDRKSFPIKLVRQDLRVLTDFRNVCAHGERFYCHETNQINIRPNKRADVTHLMAVVRRYMRKDDFRMFIDAMLSLPHDFVEKGALQPESLRNFFEVLGFEVVDADASVLQLTL